MIKYHEEHEFKRGFIDFINRIVNNKQIYDNDNQYIQYFLIKLEIHKDGFGAIDRYIKSISSISHSHINCDLIIALTRIPEDNSDVYFKQYMEYLLGFIEIEDGGGKQQSIKDFYTRHMTPRCAPLKDSDKKILNLPLPKFKFI